MNKVYQNEGKISLGSLAQLFANRDYNYTNQDIHSLTKIKNSYLADENFTYFKSTYRRYLDFYKVEKNEYFCTKIDFDFMSKFIFNTDYDYLNKMVLCIKLPTLELKDNYIISFLNQLCDELNLNINISKVDDELTQTILPQLYLNVKIKNEELEKEKSIIEYLFNHNDEYIFYDNYNSYENIIINIANFIKSSDLITNEYKNFFNVFLEYLNECNELDNSIDQKLDLKIININKIINSTSDVNTEDKYNYYLFKNDDGYAIIDKNLNIQEVNNNIITVSNKKYIIYNSKLYDYEYFKNNYFSLITTANLDLTNYLNTAYENIFSDDLTETTDDIDEYNLVITLILDCYYKLFVEVPENIKENLKTIIMYYITNTSRNKTSFKKIFDLYDIIVDYDISKYETTEDLINSISPTVFNYILFHFSQYNITNIVKKLITLADNKFYNNSILISNYEFLYNFSQKKNIRINEYKLLFYKNINYKINNLSESVLLTYNNLSNIDLTKPETLTILDKLKILYYYYKNLKRFNEDDSYLDDTSFLKYNNTEYDNEKEYFFAIADIMIRNIIKNIDELNINNTITNSKNFIRNLLDTRLYNINKEITIYTAFMNNVYGSNYLLYDNTYFKNLKYCDDIGYNIIQSLRIIINNQILEEWNDKYLTIYNKLHLSEDHNYGIKKVINDYENIVYIPLHFFFTDNYNISLPLNNLRDSIINMEITLKNINDVINNDCLYKKFSIQKNMINDYNINSWLIMDYIVINEKYITDYDKKTKEKYNKLLTKNVKQSMLISQLQNMNFYNINRNNTQISINLKNCVKYLILYADCDDVRPFEKINIFFNGMRWINEEQSSEVFEYVEKYKRFTNCKDDNIYIINFSLYPNFFQPSGTINFSKVDNFSIEFKFKNDYLNNKTNKDVKVYIYACGYNILKIENGYGLLEFN